MRLLLHHRRCLQEDIWTLKGIKPSHKKQDWLICWQAKMLTSLLAIIGLKALEIDATGNYFNLTRNGSTVADHLGTLVVSSGDNAVGLFDEIAFHLQAQDWLRFRRIGQLFEMCQCMEHGHVRDLPASSKPLCSYSR